MHKLWHTIVAPLLDALRPALILEVGGGEDRVARLCAQHVVPWHGRVLSLRPSAVSSKRANLSIEALGDVSSLASSPRPDVVLLHGGQSWSLEAILDQLIEAASGAELRLPTFVIHGVGAGPARGVARERALRSVHVQGLGGTTIVSSQDGREGDFGRVLDELRAPGLLDAQLALIDTEREAEIGRAQHWEMRAKSAEEQGLDQEVLLAERNELRSRLVELSVATKPASAVLPAAGLEEPTQAHVRELLKPSALLAELDLHGPEEALAVAIPGDPALLPYPDNVEAKPVRAVAYLLPGMPPEGSGGSHSLVQEARGLRALNCEGRVCVPSSALEVATALYGNDDQLFVAYDDASEILDAVGPAEVVIATEHPSMSMLEALASARPEVACAYYVQDYEPLFAPPGSARSDRALLSYRAIPGLLLFAKTHWLRNVVSALHGVRVAKVEPSLDRKIFNTKNRSDSDGTVRIAAMVRPRTPRRRPTATLDVLARIRAELPDSVRTYTFGCDAHAYSQLAGVSASKDHLGLLSRDEVSELMRRCDIFIDASAYQAFGRSGLEAMACGTVPVLPILGGVHEYARREENCLMFEDDHPATIAEGVLALARDPARLERLRAAGTLTAESFSVERAAHSQLELFTALVSRRARAAGALAWAPMKPIPS